MTDDLVRRLRLLAAWRRKGGPTPTEGMPSTHQTALEAAARIEALEGENRKLREALSNVQYEADREHGGLVHLKRAVSNAARAALAEDKSDG